MLGSNRKIMITDVAMLIISLIYIPFMLSHLLFIRRLDFGNILVWLVFLGAFMTDSCAFFAGKLFGKHKLCPNISPKKTIEGAVGGVIGCGLGFLLFAFIINTFISAYIGGAEMSYMLMQSYDFLHLYETYGCKLEMGGNDQWSNILGGVDLIRRIGKDDSYGLTFKLLTTKEGKKMGKTEKGALWLDPTKTSPYEFYQYWRNIEDESVETVLKLLTFLPIEKINELASLKDEKINAKIPVVYSDEIPIKVKEKIGSTSFVPATCGLLCASYIINDIIKE